MENRKQREEEGMEDPKQREEEGMERFIRLAQCMEDN